MNDTKTTILIFIGIIYFSVTGFLIGTQYNELQHFLNDKVVTSAKCVCETTLLKSSDAFVSYGEPKALSVVFPPLTGGGEAVATWYDYPLDGAPEYSTYTATAASRVYPRGTWLQVWNNKAIVVVRVNDYGPEEWTGKDIDLSSYAFKQLSPLSRGVIAVRINEL